MADSVVACSAFNRRGTVHTWVPETDKYGGHWRKPICGARSRELHWDLDERIDGLPRCSKCARVVTFAPGKESNDG